MIAIVFAASAVFGLGIDELGCSRKTIQAVRSDCVVPYPPGGGTDIAARWIADKLSAQFNEKVFVDNRAGANGNLGTDFIAKSAPDGYVIGMATPGPVTVGRSLYADLPYDPKKDLAPIILANESPIVLVVNSKISGQSPSRSWSPRRNPDRANCLPRWCPPARCRTS